MGRVTVELNSYIKYTRTHTHAYEYMDRGRNRQEGSEHFIEGKQHAAELHMVL